MSELFGVFAALFANLIGGVFVFKRIGAIEPLAWVVFGAVAFGQIGLSLRFGGPEPMPMLKFMAMNIAIGLVVSLAVRQFYRSLAKRRR